MIYRSLMYSEANRRETFTSWPHTGYRWAQPDPMSQAGFYHQVCVITMAMIIFKLTVTLKFCPNQVLFGLLFVWYVFLVSFFHRLNDSS